MSIHVVSLLFEVVFLKARSFKTLGRFQGNFFIVLKVTIYSSIVSISMCGHVSINIMFGVCVCIYNVSISVSCMYGVFVYVNVS